MLAFFTSTVGRGASALGVQAPDAPGPRRRRLRRGRPAEGESPTPGSAVRLRHPLFVSGTNGAGAFRGRAVAVAVDAGAIAGADRTRYLVEAVGQEPFWVLEAEIERSYPLLPGDAVIGYVTVRPGERIAIRRAAIAALRATCERSGWRLAGVVLDNERDPVAGRPGLGRAVERIAAGEAAGLIVADLARAAGTDPALAALMNAVRGAGGGFAAVDPDDHDRRAVSARRTARGDRAAVAQRIAELRTDGLAPQAIAEVLNDEGVPAPPGVDGLWHAWSVREAGRIAPRRTPPRPPGRDPYRAPRG